MKKNKKWILFIILIVLFIVLIILAFFNHGKKESDDEGKIKILSGVYNDPDCVTITNQSLKKEQCINDLCVRNVVLNSYPNKGSITYKITNKSNKELSGYLKLVFDSYTAYIVYDKLGAGKTEDGYVGYSGFDLRNEKEYKLQKLTDSEYSAIIK